MSSEGKRSLFPECERRGRKKGEGGFDVFFLSCPCRLPRLVQITYLGSIELNGAKDKTSRHQDNSWVKKRWACGGHLGSAFLPTQATS